MIQMHVNYLTNTKGKKVAVQIPFPEWSALMSEYQRLQQYYGLKNDLIDSFREIAEIEKGEKVVSTLSEFLNEH
jgi:hypothetical protein